MALANITSTYRAKLIANTYLKWIKPNSEVLDAGCGNGVVAYELQKILQIEVVGCDVDTYITTPIVFKKMLSENKLPFKKNSFESVMFNDVLHHTNPDNQILLIKEALRVGNEALLFELKPRLLSKIFDFILNKMHHPSMNIPFTYRTERAWEQLFKTSKLKWTKKSVITPFWYPFSHIAYRLYSK